MALIVKNAHKFLDLIIADMSRKEIII